MPHLGYDRIALESMHWNHADVAERVLDFAPDILGQAFEIHRAPCERVFELLDFAFQPCNALVAAIKTAIKTANKVIQRIGTRRAVGGCGVSFHLLAKKGISTTSMSSAVIFTLHIA